MSSAPERLGNAIERARALQSDRLEAAVSGIKQLPSAPGGYRFSDFARLGIPMNLLLWAVTSLLAPLVFGF